MFFNWVKKPSLYQQVQDNTLAIKKMLEYIQDVYFSTTDMTEEQTTIDISQTNIPAGTQAGYLFSPNGLLFSILDVDNSDVYVKYRVTLAGPQGPTGATGPQGPTGATGPQGDPGKIALVTKIARPTNSEPKVGSVTMVQNQDLNRPGQVNEIANIFQTYQNILYLVIGQCINASEVPTGTSDFRITSVVKIEGAQGPQGPQGPQGTPGTQGPPGADGKDGKSGIECNAIIRIAGAPKPNQTFGLAYDNFNREPIVNDKLNLFYIDINTNILYLLGGVIYQLTDNPENAWFRIDYVSQLLNNVSEINYKGQWVSGDEIHINDLVYYDINSNSRVYYLALNVITSSTTSPNEDTTNFKEFIEIPLSSGGGGGVPETSEGESGTNELTAELSNESGKFEFKKTAVDKESQATNYTETFGSDFQPLLSQGDPHIGFAFDSHDYSPTEVYSTGCGVNNDTDIMMYSLKGTKDTKEVTEGCAITCSGEGLQILAANKPINIMLQQANMTIGDAFGTSLFAAMLSKINGSAGDKNYLKFSFRTSDANLSQELAIIIGRCTSNDTIIFQNEDETKGLTAFVQPMSQTAIASPVSVSDTSATGFKTHATDTYDCVYIALLHDLIS